MNEEQNMCDVNGLTKGNWLLELNGSNRRRCKMKNAIVMTMLVAMVALLASSAQADLVVTSDADSTVSGGATGTNYGTSTVLQIRNGSASYKMKSWIRFDISGWTAGKSNITSATIDLTVSYRSSTETVPLHVYALNNGTGTDPYGSGDLDESWGETAITWANAPANREASDTVWGDYTTLLHTFTNVPAAGTLLSFTITDADQLAFLTGDTNDKVTIILCRTSGSGTPRSYIASKENATYDPPKLTLTPEPATMTLLLLGLPLALRRRRK
ncbi:MAG: DNRLRE domain-containing protein [Phycisphaerae bacterium]|nr:DNRLRE domain-containing protein [Phycisphaerae bacterium]